ncbi:MAG TPA: AsmA family protein [Terriglobales bacterium]|nr:AsmA family protein [Terriglobales bacterium]
MLTQSQKRFFVAIALFLAVALFLVPAINFTRYRAMVGRSLSQALGRDVSVRGVHLSLLPPGLKLDGLIVSDDPGISAEPILRADEVSVSLRWTSLWRGRLEIASLSLRYPSFNLVRGANGRWNIESLLERARQTPAAPTAKPRPESRIRFPYVEFLNGRVNLKIGQEKKVYALADTDFAVWLASEDVWRMRLEARPIRTDANLGDTGTVKLSGTLQRAASLAEMPMVLHFSWERGQLGQLTYLAYGRDRGWRGTVGVSADLKGTPQDLRFATDASLSDFRRYDIASTGSLRLAVRCSGRFGIHGHEWRDLSCEAPAAGGFLRASGNIVGQPEKRIYDLSFTADNLPAQFLADLARHAKQGMPDDLTATGKLDAMATLRTPLVGGDKLWAGNGSTSAIELRSRVLTSSLTLKPASFTLAGPGTENYEAVPIKRVRTKTTPIAPKISAGLLPDKMLLLLQPFSVPLGGAAPVAVEASVSRSDYDVHIQGDAQAENLLQAARVLGLGNFEAQGQVAKLDAHLAGEWSGFKLPSFSGKAQLRAATVIWEGLNAPLHIASANLVAADGKMSIDGLSANTVTLHGTITGTLQVPTACKPSPDCAVTFDLKTDQVAVDELNLLVNPKFRKRPWYAILPQGRSQPSPWSTLYAKGRVSVGKLTLKTVLASHAIADVEIRPDKLLISNLRGEALGGAFLTDISANFSGEVPVYHSQGSLLRVSMAQVAALMKDAWASGQMTASYQGSASGWDSDQLLESATGTAKFDWRDGLLPRVFLNGDGKPLLVRHFTASAELNRGVLKLAEGKLEAPGGIYQVSGTASLGRELGLNLVRDGGHQISLGGTLEKPKVTLVGEASLR